MNTAESLCKRMNNGEKLYCVSCKKYTKHEIIGKMFLYTGCAKCGREYSETGMPVCYSKGRNAYSIGLAIAIVVATVIVSYQITIGSFAIKDVDILRTIWAACGIAGYLLMRWKRAEFYKNRSILFWLGIFIAYYCLGPGILACGLICWLCPPLKM